MVVRVSISACFWFISMNVNKIRQYSDFSHVEMPKNAFFCPSSCQNASVSKRIIMVLKKISTIHIVDI